MKAIRARLLLSSCIVSAAMSVVACGGGGNNDLGDRLGTSNPSVRFANGMPDSQLGLYRNGSNSGLNENAISYGDITKFSSFSADNSTFSVRNPANQVVGTAGGFNGANGHRYLAFAFPDVANATASGNVNLQVLDDPYNRRASVVPTVRIVNAVPASSNFDVYVSKPGDSLGNPSVANFGYQSFWPASGNDSQKLDDTTGKFRIRITAAGNPGTVLFDSQEIDIDENADAVVAVLPTLPASTLLTGALKRGDLRLRINDGNSKGGASFDVVDHP